MKPHLFDVMLFTEAAPASEAGMKTCLVVRDGNAPLSDDDLQKFNVIESFNELTSSQSEGRCLASSGNCRCGFHIVNLELENDLQKLWNKLKCSVRIVHTL